MGRPIRHLPEHLAATLRIVHGQGDDALLNGLLARLADAGWGYQSAASVLGMARQSVFQRALKGDTSLPGLPAVPEAPGPQPKPQPPAPPALNPHQRARLRALQKQARHLRGEHPDEHPRRRASEELSRFIDELTRQGFTYRQIAEVIGVKPRTVRARLTRHAYRTVNPTLTPYRGRRTRQEENHGATP